MTIKKICILSSKRDTFIWDSDLDMQSKEQCEVNFEKFRVTC